MSSPSFVRYAAKAVAAFVVPWIITAAAWITAKTGVDIPIEPTVLETTIVSLVVSLAVYVKPNASKG